MSATCEGISTKARGRCQILELELQAVVSHGHGCWLQAAGGHGHGCWSMNSGVLEEHLVLLTTEPPLQLLTFL